ALPICVTYGASRFVTVGALGKLQTSEDGTNWVSRTVPTSNELLAVAYGGRRFVAVGTAGTVLYSDDGITWNARLSKAVDNLQGVAFGNEQYIVVGTNGVILSSPRSGSYTPEPPIFTSAPSASALAGFPFQYQITVLNSASAFTESGLPAGLVLNATNGLISGIPGVSGSFPISLTASNGGGVANFLLSLQLTKQAQTISFASLPNRYMTNPPFLLSATANPSGLPVSFAVTGPATLAANWLTLVSTGLVSVRASQPGDAIWAAAPEVTSSFQVYLTPQSVTLQSTITNRFVDVPATLAATANSGLPVSYYVVDGVGVALINGTNVTFTGPGNVRIAAIQAGNNLWAPATNFWNFTVNQRTQTIAIRTFEQPYNIEVFGPETGSIPNLFLGAPPILILASASSGLPVSLVQTQGVSALSGNFFTPQSAGMVTIQAIQSGNSVWAPLTNTQSFMVVGTNKWNPTYSRTTRNLKSVAFGSGIFVAVGESGAILVSDSTRINTYFGINWFQSATNSNESVASVTYAGGWFNAVSQVDSPTDSIYLLRSTNGFTWADTVLESTPYSTRALWPYDIA
ncbi:MAG: Ig domain-containing protein, partial [Verrucomicrobia bacterium]|nr:Ig domain-containing protein [Verrucomicrobiota bacterium]